MFAIAAKQRNADNFYFDFHAFFKIFLNREKY